MIEYYISSNADEIIKILEEFVKNYKSVEGVTITDTDGLPLVGFFHDDSQQEVIAAITPVILRDISSLPLGENQSFIASGSKYFAIIKPFDDKTYISLLCNIDTWSGVLGKKEVIKSFEELFFEIIRRTQTTDN